MLHQRLVQIIIFGRDSIVTPELFFVQNLTLKFLSKLFQVETSMLKRKNDEKCWREDITRNHGFMTKTSSLVEEDIKNFENCLAYFTRRGFNNGSVTEDEEEFPVAYSCKWLTLK